MFKAGPRLSARAQLLLLFLWGRCNTSDPQATCTCRGFMSGASPNFTPRLQTIWPAAVSGSKPFFACGHRPREYGRQLL